MKKIKSLKLLCCAVLVFTAASSRAAIQSAQRIQDLVDAAVAGEEIAVPAGEYHGTITLKDGVILRGEGDEVTILDGQGAGEVVAFGKESVLIGFTIRNGNSLLANKGNFIGVFECTLEHYAQFGLLFNGGSAVVANNIIRGSGRGIGMMCAAANPIVINNLIELNQIGIQVLPHLIPSIVGNYFLSNHTAVAFAQDAKAVLERNFFFGNGVNSTQGELPAGNDVRKLDANEFVLQRGISTDAYRTLMVESYRAAVKDHPIIVYDLHPSTGSFDAIGLFPWANFVLSASAVDTVIESFDAYDAVENRAIHAEYMVQGDARPSVRVHNPELVEKMRERYVLENRYVHGPSYFDEPGGRRIFRRMTNVSQIEVVIPSGYRVVSASPAAVIQEGADRTFLTMEDIGVTDVEVIMERSSAR